MEPRSASRAVEILPRPKEAVVPSLEYARQLNERFATEVQLLRKLNPVQNRPYEKQQRTIGERVFNLDDPSEVMEYNRSCMNVWLFDMVRDAQTEDELKTAYEAFVDCQRKSPRLTEDEVLPYEYFLTLKQLVDEAVPPELREAFRAGLMYGDLGKSFEMQEYARTVFGKAHVNHDRTLTTILQDHRATRQFMPSFFGLDEQGQQMILAMQFSGFHLGQYQKLESLPAELEPFVELPPTAQDFIMLNGLFDIAGAQGDRVQNGSMTLTKSTFEAFMLARDSFRDFPESIQQATPKTKALFAARTYLESRNSEFGFDISTPEGEALARFVSQVRVFKPNEIKLAESVFSNHLSPETQVLFRDLLTMTGYEPDGSVWFEYGPATARNVFLKLKAAGLAQISREIHGGALNPQDAPERGKQILVDALMHSMTTLARLRSSARKLLEPGKIRAITASAVAHIAENDPARILTERIVVNPVGEEEGVATLEPMPRPAIAEQLDNLAFLRSPEGHTLYVGVGGGSDCDFARTVARDLVADKNAPVTSFPGVDAQHIHNAIQLSQRIFIAQENTYFTGPRSRSFERFAAQHGPCYIIAGAGQAAFAGLDQAFLEIAGDISDRTGRPVSQIVTVDSGGDIFKPTPSASGRDQASLAAVAQLEAQLGIAKSHSVVLIPGTDIDASLEHYTAKLPVAGLHLGPYVDTILSHYEQRGWPSPHAAEYSQMIETAYRAFRTHQEGGIHGVEPLSLPASQMLTRPAFTVTSDAMLWALVVPNQQLRQLHRL